MQETLTFQLHKRELALLRKIKVLVMCPDSVLDSAVAIGEEYYELSGATSVLDSLAGFLALEANHARSETKAHLLNGIADAVESALR